MSPLEFEITRVDCKDNIDTTYETIDAQRKKEELQQRNRLGTVSRKTTDKDLYSFKK